MAQMALSNFLEAQKSVKERKSLKELKASNELNT